MKYIDADKLIAKIEQFKQENETSDDKEYAQYELDVACGYDMACEEILSSIDSLQQEQPEVDLEKEIGCWMDKLDDKYYMFVENYSIQDIKDTARHFYELGLNARKK